MSVTVKSFLLLYFLDAKLSKGLDTTYINKTVCYHAKKTCLYRPDMSVFLNSNSIRHLILKLLNASDLISDLLLLSSTISAINLPSFLL